MKPSQIVLVTGATSGIGRHAALYLAEKGYRILASGRNQAGLTALKEESDQAGLDLATLELDVTSKDSIAAAVTEVDRLTDGYGLDVLINNAGYGLAGPLSEIGDDELRHQYDTNVLGLMAVTRAFIPAMSKRGEGKILNVGSVAGRMTLPMFGAYDSTKYAVESLSDALRFELRPFGIQVVLIEPGVIRTNFTPRSMELVAEHGQATSPYASAVSRLEKLAVTSKRFAVGPACVSRAIYRAIRRRRPAARYIAPFRTRIVLAFYQLMPTRMSDALLRHTLGLTRRKISGGQSAGHPQLSSTR